jgi:hypothetical protein
MKLHQKLQNSAECNTVKKPTSSSKNRNNKLIGLKFRKFFRSYGSEN